MQPTISPPDLRTMVLSEAGDRARDVSCLSIVKVAALQIGRDRLPDGCSPNPNALVRSQQQHPISSATPCAAVRRQSGPASPVLFQKPSLGRQGVCAC